MVSQNNICIGFVRDAETELQPAKSRYQRLQLHWHSQFSTTPHDGRRVVYGDD